ncbi:MAG: hypothetical protein PWQ15_1529 [Methanobacterium sp.]|jgi:hypothetical protein|uniref:Uncharacterized protein n=1 Tax=Methanobacterium formicicum TaxID=2162 RepID=A0A090I5F1_METFO|nr:MAG: hypothetical protein XD90_0116 [Methanobacterium sp. 42_16]MDI3550426.1 hypothetical protein [Methanobacterium sp.]CEA14747.1 hypothetical protein DSM1535_2350 [Methanobacterium formicicum]
MSSRSGIRGKNFQKDKFENLSQENEGKKDEN